MKLWIMSAALAGTLLAGGCAKQSAEGNATTVDATVNTGDAAIGNGEADNGLATNGFDAGAANDSGDASGNGTATAGNS